MRNLLAFAGAAVLTFAGVGWYLDWYRIQTGPASMGHHHLNIDINSVKIVEDVHKGIQKGEKQLQKVLEKTRPDQTSSRAESFPVAPGQEVPNQ